LALYRRWRGNAGHMRARHDDEYWPIAIRLIPANIRPIKNGKSWSEIQNQASEKSFALPLIG